MTAKINALVELKLDLTLKEAWMLKAMVQNPMKEDEDEITHSIRNKIWNNLHALPINELLSYEE